MELAQQLQEILPRERFSTDYFDRIAFANDASVYRRVPRAIAHAHDLQEVQSLIRLARRHNLPITFRAAGTSLSGQAVTDGLLIVLSRGWRDYEILDQGRRIRLQPGVVGGVANLMLAPYRRKIGPDPASIQACMLGGILANNSSGMCCGTSQNAYQTLESMRFALANGVVIDSANDDADAQLREAAPEIVDGLQTIRRRIHNNPTLVKRIRRKFGMKNTMGYSLNSFLDYERPAELLAHLMIGSEGTLGFIAEAVLRTVPDAPLKYTGLLFFDSVASACEAIRPLATSGAQALELMDRPSLRAVQTQPGVPAAVATLPAQAAALLVEYPCEDEADRQRCVEEVEQLIGQLPLYGEAEWTIDPDRQAQLWSVRKGLIPSVGAMRAKRTSFIIEDVVFPVDRLAEGVVELQALLAEFAYHDAIVFGHAKDGNLHFVLTQSFEQRSEIDRYDRFMQRLAELVAVRYGGALKAEHGTGRNMAPFVETEWGRDAVREMRALKQLLDPEGILNPGVILNDDPQAHVKDLKALPAVEPEIDPCIECGFCERWCPSRDLTLTPRQRIVVRRELSRLRQEDPTSERIQQLEQRWRYEGEESCAADGLCALACPVSIDTGALTRSLRQKRWGEAEQTFARWAVQRFDWIERAGRTLLRLGRLGNALGISRLPGVARRPARATAGPADAILFNSCLQRVLVTTEEPSPAELAQSVSARAGVTLEIPNTEGLCCGMPFASKGFSTAHRDALERTVERLWHLSDRGRLPIIIDSSPCAMTLRSGHHGLPTTRKRELQQMQIVDAVAFARERLMPHLDLNPVQKRVSMHAVCSLRRAGLESALQEIGEACATDCPVTVGGCCGAAGDRTFSAPELPAAATAPLEREWERAGVEELFSSSLSCELSLTRETGRPVRSFWALLEAASSPKNVE